MGPKVIAKMLVGRMQFERKKYGGPAFDPDDRRADAIDHCSN